MMDNNMMNNNMLDNNILNSNMLDKSMTVDNRKNTTLKEKIDLELNSLTFHDNLKDRIMNHKRTKKSFLIKYAAAAAAIVILSGTTAAAGYYLLNKINVNETVLPELDRMRVIDSIPIDAAADGSGMIHETFTDYGTLKEQMGIPLLDSELAKNNPYIQGSVMTDNKNFAIITVQNYILGDTSNFNYLADEGWYQYDSGEDYFTPVSLTADIILSEDQLATGWDRDYLGMYQYVESYTSAQGYKVNIIEDTTGGEAVNNYISEKYAVFTADGIRYTLKGRTSLDTMKAIVDSMK